MITVKKILIEADDGNVYELTSGILYGEVDTGEYLFTGHNVNKSELVELTSEIVGQAMVHLSKKVAEDTKAKIEAASSGPHLKVKNSIPFTSPNAKESTGAKNGKT